MLNIAIFSNLAVRRRKGEEGDISSCNLNNIGIFFSLSSFEFEKMEQKYAMGSSGFFSPSRVYKQDWYPLLKAQSLSVSPESRSKNTCKNQSWSNQKRTWGCNCGRNRRSSLSSTRQTGAWQYHFRGKRTYSSPRDQSRPLGLWKRDRDRKRRPNTAMALWLRATPAPGSNRIKVGCWGISRKFMLQSRCAAWCMAWPYLKTIQVSSSSIQRSRTKG